MKPKFRRISTALSNASGAAGCLGVGHYSFHGMLHKHQPLTDTPPSRLSTVGYFCKVNVGYHIGQIVPSTCHRTFERFCA